MDLKENVDSTENNGDLKEHFSKAKKYICVSVSKDKGNALVELAAAVTASCLGQGLGDELEVIPYQTLLIRDFLSRVFACLCSKRKNVGPLESEY